MPRFRTLSTLTATLVAGLLIGVNIRSKATQTFPNPPPGTVILKDARNEYGWPLKAVGRAGFVLPEKEFQRWCLEPEWYRIGRALDRNDGKVIRFQDKATVTREPDGVHVLYDGYVDNGNLAINAAVLLACSALALFLCEYFLRRRDARAKAKVPA